LLRWLKREAVLGQARCLLPRLPSGSRLSVLLFHRPLLKLRVNVRLVQRIRHPTVFTLFLSQVHHKLGQHLLD
jgi:hypothetical protein